MGAALALLLAAASVVDAVKAGDRAAVVRAIEARADVNAAEPDGTTALHWAVIRDDAEVVRTLLRAGAKAGARNDYGATPLSEAATLGSTRIIQLLLEAGAEPEAANADGQTALMLVARTGNVEAARLLLARGAQVNARERWREQTPLMWAVAQRQPEMVRELLSHGADANAVSQVNQWQRQVSAEPRALHRPAGGLTPLLFAAREGCLDCARLLLDRGARLDAGDPEGITPLILAILNGHFDLASELIDRGADIHRWDIFGRTPLYAAVDMNTIPRGGRPDGPSPDTTTALQLIEQLLAAGVNPNASLKLLPPMRHVIDDRAIDSSIVIGATPLLRAAKALDAPAIALLLRHGARVDLPNSRGMTSAMVAAGLGSTDADSRGYYTKSDVQQRSIAALTLLREAGADINAKDGRGLTALHEAARWGWNDVIRYLVANGANVAAADNRGLTAVDSALGRAGGNSKFGQRIDVFPETAALLRGFGAVEREQKPAAAPAPQPAAVSVDGPWVGTWRRRNPTPGPEVWVLTFLKEGDGIRYTIDVTGPGESPRQMSAFIRFDGKPYPETGNPTADHNVFTRLDDRTLQIVDLKDGKETVRFRVTYSPDGKTRTSTSTRTEPDGRTVSSTVVWDRVE